jgi:hypothetical protein
MYFQLDDIRFTGLYGPSALDYRYSERIAKTALLNGKAALLRTGTELTEYKVDLTLHFTFVNVVRAIAALREKQSNNLVCAFVDGTGTLIGDVVIMSIDVSESRRSPRGELTSAKLQLVLVEYAPIGANDPARGRDFDAAKALAENNVASVLIESRPATDAAELVSNVSGSLADLRAADLEAKIVVTAPPAQRVRNMVKLAKSANKAAQKAREALSFLARVRTLVAQAPALVEQLETIVERAEALKDAAERGDLTDVSANAGGLLNIVSSAFDATRPLNRLLILRRL